MGVPAGIALIGVIGWLLIRRKSRASRVELEAGGGGGGGGVGGEPVESREGGEYGERQESRERFSELPSERVKSELPSERVTSELSAGSWKKASFMGDAVSNIESRGSVDKGVVRHELPAGE